MSGFADGGDAFGNGRAEILYDLTFQISDPTPYAFDVDYSDSTVPESSAFDTTSLTLFDASGAEIFLVEGTGPFPPEPILLTGVFAPGEYRLVLDLLLSGDGGGTTFEVVAAIPEPGTAALLGPGLAGLALQRRRRRYGSATR